MRCIVLPEPRYTWLGTETSPMEVGCSSSSDNSINDHSSTSSPFTSPSSPFFGPVSPASPKTAKLEEDFLLLPAEDEKLLQNFEILLLQIQKNEAAASILAQTPPESPRLGANQNNDDVDIASSLLQSLIQGDNFADNSSQSSDFSADFDLTFIEDTVSSSGPKTPRRRSRPAKKNPYSLGEESEDSSTGIRRRGPRRKLPVEDRKSRKKEQNKTAATRYRMKKKAEIEELTAQENELAEDKVRLQKEHDELANELRYLKKLMREAGILE